MTRPSNIEFDRAVDDDSLKGLLTNLIEKHRDLSSPRAWPSRGVKFLVVHALLLALASTFFTLWITTINATCPLDPLLTYSPVNEAVRYVEKRFDATANSTSIYRGPPSPEIDAAWARISIDVKATRLTHEQFLMTGGNDTTAAVKYLPEDGGGYMSQVDGYHHLHCLDLLRKYLTPDYYVSISDPAFNDKLRPHLGHCVEILRQKIMCTSDLTMVTYDWVAGLDDPQPNLNTIHQCMDYERILDWSDKHNAHVLSGHVVRFGDVEDLQEDPM